MQSPASPRSPRRTVPPFSIIRHMLLPVASLSVFFNSIIVVVFAVRISFFLDGHSRKFVQDAIRNCNLISADFRNAKFEFNFHPTIAQFAIGVIATLAGVFACAITYVGMWVPASVMQMGFNAMESEGIDYIWNFLFWVPFGSIGLSGYIFYRERDVALLSGCGISNDGKKSHCTYETATCYAFERYGVAGIEDMGKICSVVRTMRWLTLGNTVCSSFLLALFIPVYLKRRKHRAEEKRQKEMTGEKRSEWELKKAEQGQRKTSRTTKLLLCFYLLQFLMQWRPASEPITWMLESVAHRLSTMWHWVH